MKISIPLSISLLLNLVLSGLVGYALLERDRAVLQGSDVAQEIPHFEKEQAPVPSFNWSQLDSTDNSTYIANLRKIGCPERIIRLILTDRVTDFYEEKAKIGNDLQRGALTPAGHNNIAALQQEQDQVLLKLLGPTPAIQSESSNSGPVVESSIVDSTVQSGITTVGPSAETVSMPLVFLNLNTDQSPITERQQSVLEGLQQSFIDAIGGMNQNPSTPQYLESWKNAQWQSDQQYRQKFGWQAYMAQTMQAAMQRGSL